jgi:4-amino-4-deoxy-L-arabinose transferase-like glycosyltransferase
MINKLILRINVFNLLATPAWLFALAVWIWQLQNPLNLSEGDEKLYIQIVKDMLASGDLFHLRYFGELAHFKPPLLYWNAFLLGQLVEPTLWMFRLIPLLYALLAGILVVLLYRQMFSNRLAGEEWIAGGLFLGTWCGFKYGSLFMMDMPLVALVLFVYWVFRQKFKGGTLWPGLLSGVVCFMKGPVGWVLCTLLLLTHQLSYKTVRIRDWIGYLFGSALSIGCMLVVLNVGMGTEEFSAFLGHFLGREHGAKFSGEWLSFLSGPYPLIRIWGGWYYLLSPLAVLACVPIGGLLKNQLKDPPSLGFLGLAIVLTLLLFSLPTQRQENYILLTTPLTCMMATRLLHRYPWPWLSAFTRVMLLGLAAAVGYPATLGYGHPWLGVLSGLCAAMGLIGLRRFWLAWLPALTLGFWVTVQMINWDLSRFQIPSQTLKDATRGQIVLYEENFRSLSTWIQELLPEAEILPLTISHRITHPKALMLITLETAKEMDLDHESLATWKRWKRQISWNLLKKAYEYRNWAIIMDEYVLVPNSTRDL